MCVQISMPQKLYCCNLKHHTTAVAFTRSLHVFLHVYLYLKPSHFHDRLAFFHFSLCIIIGQCAGCKNNIPLYVTEVFAKLVAMEDEDGKFLPELVGVLLQMVRSQELYEHQRKQPPSGDASKGAKDKTKETAKTKEKGTNEVSSSVSRAYVVFHLLAEVARAGIFYYCVCLKAHSNSSLNIAQTSLISRHNPINSLAITISISHTTTSKPPPRLDQVLGASLPSVQSFAGAQLLPTLCHVMIGVSSCHEVGVCTGAKYALLSFSIILWVLLTLPLRVIFWVSRRIFSCQILVVVYITAPTMHCRYSDI